MFEQQNAGIECERATEPDAHARRLVDVADAPIEFGIGKPDLLCDRDSLACDVGVWRLDLQ